MSRRDQISQKRILKVADLVTTVYECEQIVSQLGINKDFVTKKKEEGIRRPNEIALYILREWQRLKGDRATADKLLRAFGTKSLRHLKAPLVHRKGAPVLMPMFQFIGLNLQYL